VDLSPKFQDQQVGDPVLLSVNFTVLPDILVENAAQGVFAATAGFETTMLMTFVIASLPIPITSSVTLYKSRFHSTF